MGGYLLSIHLVGNKHVNEVSGHCPSVLAYIVHMLCPVWVMHEGYIRDDEGVVVVAIRVLFLYV